MTQTTESIAEQRGYAAGLAEGRADTRELIDVLRLTRAMLADKRLIAQLPRDSNNPDAAPQTLQQMIEKALRPFDA